VFLGFHPAAIPIAVTGPHDQLFRVQFLRPGTGRTLRGAALQIASADTMQHAMATTKASR
jgi:hypothetical protein